MDNKCKNYDCKNYVKDVKRICADCVEAARTLDHKVEYNLRLEQLQTLDKNEGLRRHKKGSGR